MNNAWHTGHASSLYAQCVIGVDFASFENLLLFGCNLCYTTLSR
ncbi:hypothetical protein QIA20_07400 (plasmid) [Borreliella japonica]